MSKTFNPEGRAICNFQPLPDGRWQCPKCKTVRDRQKVRLCQTESEQAKLRQQNREKRREARQAKVATSAAKVSTPPGRLTKSRRWLTAMARWLWESYKARRWMIRSEAEYRRVRRICTGCENWNAAKEECKICGCGGRSKVVLLNKLRIESEKCPEGKW